MSGNVIILKDFSGYTSFRRKLKKKISRRQTRKISILSKNSGVFIHTNKSSKKVAREDSL